MKDSAQFLPFQLNYRFVCKCCNYPTWTESFRLAKSSWIESVLSAQSHLMWKTQRDIFRVAEVADFVEHNWHLLCVDELRDTSSASANLSNGSKPPLPQQGGDLAVVESPLSTCGGASPLRTRCRRRCALVLTQSKEGKAAHLIGGADELLLVGGVSAALLLLCAGGGGRGSGLPLGGRGSALDLGGRGGGEADIGGGCKAVQGLNGLLTPFSLFLWRRP